MPRHIVFFFVAHFVFFFRKLSLGLQQMLELYSDYPRLLEMKGTSVVVDFRCFTKFKVQMVKPQEYFRHFPSVFPFFAHAQYV